LGWPVLRQLATELRALLLNAARMQLGHRIALPISETTRPAGAAARTFKRTEPRAKASKPYLIGGLE